MQSSHFQKACIDCLWKTHSQLHFSLNGFHVAHTVLLLARFELHACRFRCDKDKSGVKQHVLVLKTWRPCAVNNTIPPPPAEQCLHVLRLIQLLPEPQTLCEVQGWQPVEWCPVFFIGMILEMCLFFSSSRCFRKVFCTSVTFTDDYRSPAKNVSRTERMMDCPLLHAGP